MTPRCRRGPMAPNNGNGSGASLPHPCTASTQWNPQPGVPCHSHAFRASARAPTVRANRPRLPATRLLPLKFVPAGRATPPLLHPSQRRAVAAPSVLETPKKQHNRSVLRCQHFASTAACRQLLSRLPPSPWPPAPVGMTEQSHPATQQASARFPRVGSYTTPGVRGRASNYQHDRYVCHSDEHATVLVVFDGHGRPHNGHLISHHCATNFLSLLQKHSAWTEPNFEREQPDDAMETALVSVVAQLENDSLAITDQMRQFSGTTLCAVILKDGFLYTANVGDSRAVLGVKSCSAGTSLKSLQLTADHNCTVPSERKRIEDNGGFVARNRLNGDLDMSRTIGDHEFKVYRNQVRFNPSEQQYGEHLLIATPDITSRKLDGDEIVVIVATDGLWIQAVENDLAVTVAHSMLQRGKDAEKVAKGLAQFALGSGSSDNITVVVGVLGAVEKSERRHAFHELRARRRLRRNGLRDEGKADGTPRRSSRVRSLFSRRPAEDENTVHNAHEFDDLTREDDDMGDQGGTQGDGPRLERQSYEV